MKEGKKNKQSHPDWKRRNKTIFTDYRILYTENHEQSTTNYQNNKLIKVAGYKIIYKNQLYDQNKNKIKKAIHL